MNTDLALLILLIALSGAFSGAEIALTSLSKATVRALQKDHKFGSSAIVKLKQKSQNVLIAVLIGNNVVNVLATVIATLWGVRVFGDHAIGIITGLLTFVILVFGEITPKTLAQKFNLAFARVVAYPLLWLVWLMSPIIWIFLRFTNGLIRLFRIDRHHHPMSEEEILAMVDIGTEEGVIEEHEQELIENVLELDETTVAEVMTITRHVEALPASTSVKDAALYFIEHSHSRIPVYEGSLDNVIGILTMHDILELIHKPHDNEIIRNFDYPPTIVVPTTKTIRELFKEFQKRRKHMAMVVNDRGETVGLVTMEDILEEIVGEIVDEEDEESHMVYKIDNSTWEAHGEAKIEEVNEIMGLELPFPEHQTISLLILEQLHRFPKSGEKISYENVLFQVKEMSKKKIEKVEITKSDKPPVKHLHE